jgi:hypothetical protein
VLHKIKTVLFEEFNTFFGVEVASTEGDILAYGITMVPSKGLRASQIISSIHRQGGIAVAAHPFSNRHLAFHDTVYNYNFDAIEINGSIGKSNNEKARRAAKSMGLPLIGGSDAHSKDQLNTIATLFRKPINSMGDIVKAIKEKECKAVRV